MQDYAKLFHQERRRRIVAEAKLGRVRKALTSGLPNLIVLAMVCFVVRE